jgi:hypothetical protein
MLCFAELSLPVSKVTEELGVREQVGFPARLAEGEDDRCGDHPQGEKE